MTLVGNRVEEFMSANPVEAPYGWLYLAQLDPHLRPGRIKFGWTNQVPPRGRITQYLAGTPELEVLGAFRVPPELMNYFASPQRAEKQLWLWLKTKCAHQPIPYGAGRTGDSAESADFDDPAAVLSTFQEMLNDLVVLFRARQIMSLVDPTRLTNYYRSLSEVKALVPDAGMSWQREVPRANVPSTCCWTTVHPRLADEAGTVSLASIRGSTCANDGRIVADSGPWR